MPQQNHAPLFANRAEVHRFLTARYGNVPGLFQVFPAGSYAGQCFSTDEAGIDAATLHVVTLDALGAHSIYSRMTTITEAPPEGKRGGIALSFHFTGPWSDLDFGEEGHKDDNNPPDAEAAQETYDATGLPKATIVVNSGGGLYHHVLLKEPVDVRDPEVRQRIGDLSARWQARIEVTAKEAGYSYGRGVGNLDRLLRIPGTVNRKPDTTPRMATAEYSGHRYSLEELEAALPAPQERRYVPAGGRKGGTAPTGQDGTLKELLRGVQRGATAEEDLRVLIGVFLSERAQGIGDGRNARLLVLAKAALQYAEAGQLEAEDVKEAFTEAADEIGLEPHEIVATLKSAHGYAQADPKAFEPRRARSDANKFADAYMADTIAREALANSYCWSLGMGWLEWTGKLWKSCDESAVVDAIRLYVIDRTEDAVARMRIPEEEAIARSDLAGWSKFHTVTKLKGIVSLVKKPVTVDDANLDSHRDLLNCDNGVVNLRTGEVGPHDPALLMTRIAVHYDPNAESNDWNAILTAMGDGIQIWMQAVVGQAATGYRTDRDLVPVLQGGGDNGKSTLMVALAKAFGTYFTLVPDELLLGRAQRDESMVLRGARFALIEETPEGAYLNAAMLKKVTSPQMQGHNLYAKTVSWDATHTLFMTTNYEPVIAESDDGTWRRVALVRFLLKFVRREPQKPHERRGDPTLIRRVETGEEQILRAALRWIVDGAKAWFKAGMVTPELPDGIKADTRSWRMKKDLILGVWAELVEPDAGSHVATMDLWSQYEIWAKARGHVNPGTLRTFVSKFEEHPETTNNGVTRKDGVRATKGGLSRPPEVYGPPLPQQFSAFIGVRFRPRNTTPEGSEQGQCDPCDPSNQTSLREEPYGKFPFMGHMGHTSEITAGQSESVRAPGRRLVLPKKDS